jgi:hypothetical protein
MGLGRAILNSQVLMNQRNEDSEPILTSKPLPARFQTETPKVPLNKSFSSEARAASPTSHPSCYYKSLTSLSFASTTERLSMMRPLGKVAVPKS